MLAEQAADERAFGTLSAPHWTGYQIANRLLANELSSLRNDLRRDDRRRDPKPSVHVPHLVRSLW